MKRRKLFLILSSALLLFLAGVLFFGFSYLGWGFGPQLTDIEVGMTHEEILELLPGVKTLESFWAQRMIYFHGSQRAFVIFDYRNTTVLGYAVFNALRQPLKVDLSSASVPSEMVSSSLMHADFSHSTLFELMDRYRFSYSTRSDMGHTQSLLLDNGRVLYLSGPILWTSDAYCAFEQEYCGGFDFLAYNDCLSVIEDTYISLVTVWDIFRFKPGGKWTDIEETIIFEENPSDIDRKNSEYFLRWIQEHIPEGMTSEEVDRWIEDYRANNPE